MNAIVRGLAHGHDHEQIMVIFALSGSGKTQLAIKFARENDDMCVITQPSETLVLTLSGMITFSSSTQVRPIVSKTV